jgi:hypothetical protein
MIAFHPPRQRPFFTIFFEDSMLFQGESFAEFREEWDDDQRTPPMIEAIRMINVQTEIIEEALNQPMNSPLRRRQVMAYLLEQCVLLCATLGSERMRDRRRFRRIRRFVEQARRISRGDGL